MTELFRGKYLGPVLLCFLSQSVVSALVTLQFSQQAPGLVDAHFFDASGGYLMLDALRIEGKVLGRASLEALLLMAISLPLLALAHLQLLANCARHSCSVGFQLTRSALDAWGSALLLRGASGALSVVGMWQYVRASAALLHSLNAGFRWDVVGLVIMLGLALLLALAFLGVMTDHAQLSGFLKNGARPTWRRRLLLGFWESFAAPGLLAFRLARLLVSGLLAASSVALHRKLGSSVWSSVLVQGLILLSISVEACWYHALSKRALEASLRPWFRDLD